MRLSNAEKQRRYRQTLSGKMKNKNGVNRQSQRARVECLKHYGGDPPKCACCGEKEIGFLTLDHADNTGREHKRIIKGQNLARWLWSHGFPSYPPIQVLCWNCNCGRDRNNGICPHIKPLVGDTKRAERGKLQDELIAPVEEPGDLFADILEEQRT